ncbi:MAG TPA: AI-2E family transporter [Methylophilaceae bacterium]|nr:AI-2E family transporter [Methylophilaceae bacterium]
MINTSQLARIAVVVFLIVGCLFVLQPFLAAILFAAIICVFTWSWYQKLWQRLGRHDALAALVMTLLLLVALILPVAYLSANVADSATRLFNDFRPGIEHPNFPAPGWLHQIPLIGDSMHDAWERVNSSHDELMALLKRVYEPVREFGVKAVKVLGGGFLQLLLVVFITFFFYRDGARLGSVMMTMARKLGGKLGEEMMVLTCDTINGVMLGIFGTALAQAVMAFIGFAIAGVPLLFLLTSAVFILSVIPVVGSPIVWGGVALWLYNQGEYGWTIFMLLYGVFIISSVDNVIKPMLISHSVRLPFLIATLGVLGGVPAFGFIGMFLGPIFLAVGMTLLTHWITRKNPKVLKSQ